MKPLCYRIDDLSAVLGVGRTHIYHLINAGELVRIKSAGRTLVTRESVEAYVGRQIKSALCLEAGK